jgi:baculoviral IAP repeat-containing protein 6
MLLRGSLCAQVLLSIQTQILVAEPYFNEPGLESERSQPDAVARSRATNAGLRLDTLRHACAAPLRDVSAQWPELEAVVAHHFAGVRRKLLDVVK